MNQLPSFDAFLTQQSVEISLMVFGVNLLLAVILGYILTLVYTRYAHTLSNRSSFASNFILIIMTTTLIITIVKSSLALSLGLVGALSIVRFRAAIKEPEELSYLFLAIAVGLGFGAGQRPVTILAFFVIVTVIAVKSRFIKTGESPNLYLTVSSSASQNVSLDEIMEIVSRHCTNVTLKRLEEDSNGLEVAMLVDYKGIEDLNRSKEELRELDQNIRISLLESRGVI